LFTTNPARVAWDKALSFTLNIGIRPIQAHVLQICVCSLYVSAAKGDYACFLLYGCETWSVTLRKKHRVMVFGNRVLMKTFGAKKDKITEEWRRLDKEELYDLYSSPNNIRVTKSRRMRWAGHVARIGGRRGGYMVLVGRPDGKMLLGRHRRRLEDSINMNIQGVGWGGMDWIDLAEDRDR
jgi:hypothetical protein